MNNADVQQMLDDCQADITQVKTLIDGLGSTSNVVPYLTKYSLIKACGTIELAFKTIIADFCSKRTKKQIKRYLERKVRESSLNPSYSNICSLTQDFDESWHTAFKSNVSRNRLKTKLLTSLQSLVDNRNDFAHGGNPTISIGDIVIYFTDARIIIESLDNVVR